MLNHIVCTTILTQFRTGKQIFKLDGHNIHDKWVHHHGMVHLQVVDADGLLILSGCYYPEQEVVGSQQTIVL